MLQQPIPFKEEDVNKFWPDEKWDDYLPPPGFITDYVLATRGIETPTHFNMWTAFFLLSTMVKRDAWVRWFPSKFYANIYTFIVAPPRLFGKSFSINKFGRAVIENCRLHLEDPVVKVKKRINLISSKATAEGLFSMMKPKKGLVTKDQRSFNVDLGSNATIIISELATFLSKKEYNIGLIEKLTDLYDCKDIDSDTTQGRGHTKLRNVYVTLLGATTPSGLKLSIPEEAFGDGFMSRVIVVNASIEDLIRSYPFPTHVIGGPSIEDLGKSLAWICENAQGEYVFSDEAVKEYRKWYYNNRRDIMAKQDFRSRESRFDNYLIKLAFLIRIQRYEEGNEISLEDFNYAKKILTFTYRESANLVEEVGLDYLQEKYMRLCKYLVRHKRQKRVKTLQHNSRWLKFNELNLLLRQLYEEEKIHCERDGKITIPSYQDGKEEYIWEGEAHWRKIQD